MLHGGKLWRKILNYPQAYTSVKANQKQKSHASLSKRWMPSSMKKNINHRPKEQEQMPSFSSICLQKEDVCSCKKNIGGKPMEKKQKKMTFYHLNQPRKSLTPQQEKIKELSEISRRCLRSKESHDRETLFKCVQDETERQLATL